MYGMRIPAFNGFLKRFAPISLDLLPILLLPPPQPSAYPPDLQCQPKLLALQVLPLHLLVLEIKLLPDGAALLEQRLHFSGVTR
eukprot:765958-Pyramimonas_sp.AAC.1